MDLTGIGGTRIVMFGAFVGVFYPVPPFIPHWVEYAPRVEILDNLQGASGVVIVAKEDLIIYPLV